MEDYAINTFEDLYAGLACLEEKGIRDWHTERESKDVFVIDGGKSGRICVRSRKGRVHFEFWCKREMIYEDSFSCKEAYEVCLEAVQEWKVRLPNKWISVEKPDIFLPPALKRFLRIAGCIAGILLVSVCAFLLFAIWIHYDKVTPFYVYLSLTFSFGVPLLGGIALIILSVRKKGKGTHITEK